MSSPKKKPLENNPLASIHLGQGPFIRMSSVPFNPKDLNHILLVNSFCCAAQGAAREERWEEDVSNWIKSPAGSGGATDALRIGRTRIWLINTGDGRLAGYFSLGIEKIPLRSGITLEGFTIPYFGISTEFQGEPKEVDKDKRYSRLFFKCLVEYAANQRKYRDLFLYVDHENKKAVERFYPSFGFTAMYPETEGDRTWILMHKELY